MSTEKDRIYKMASGFFISALIGLIHGFVLAKAWGSYTVVKFLILFSCYIVIMVTIFVYNRDGYKK